MGAHNQLRGRARPTDPPAVPRVAIRSAVAERLVDVAGSVVLVHAPSGYGKTANVAAWARLQFRPVAWVELDGGDNEPQSLLELLCSALERVTDFDGTVLPIISGSDNQYITRIAPAFGRLVGWCATPFVMVLDDAHRVQNRTALDLIDALVHHMPAHSTIVLVSRQQPRVQLARLRLNVRVVEVTSAELALDEFAAKDLLAEMGVFPDDEEIVRLTSATEGWPVGLRLAGRVLLDDAGDVGALDRRRLDHDHAVRYYVAEEWLGGLDSETLDFLLDASCLDSLSPALCDDVLERRDSGALLQRLHVDRLLVFPLDRRGDNYRMHRLLRMVLRAESERTHRHRIRNVQCRASVWFELVGDIDQAVRYAIKAGDTARAEHLVGEYGAKFVTAGQSATIQRWLDAFPKEYVVGSASLCLMSAASALGMGRADTSLMWLDFGLQAAGEQTEPTSQAALKILALRSVLTGTDLGALADVARAYDGLALGAWHAVACWGYGMLCYWSNDLRRAEKFFSEGMAEACVAGAFTIEAQCAANLAIVCWESGDRVGAATLARKARAIVREHNLEDLPTMVQVTAVSALIEASSGDVTKARADIALTRRNLVYVKAVGTQSNVKVRLLLGQANLILGDQHGAQAVADEAATLLAEMPGVPTAWRQLDALVEQLSTVRSSLPYGPSSLTAAELRVLHFLPTHLTLTDIARRLYVSRNTAKSHAAAVYRKLGVSSRGEAVQRAQALGMVANVPEHKEPSR